MRMSLVYAGRLARVIRHTAFRRRDDLTILTLGGCNVMTAAAEMRRLRLANIVPMGSPPMYSAGEVLQYIRLCRGELPMTAMLRAYGAYDPVTLLVRARPFADADAIFVEINSSVEAEFDRQILNITHFQVRIANPIAALGARERDIAHRWFQFGLLASDEEERRATVPPLLSCMARIPDYTEIDRLAVQGVRGRFKSDDEIAQELREIREALGKPMCLISSPKQYMPDGRAISWPPGFLRRLDAIGQRLGLRIIHPHELVMRFGPERSLAPDLIHYTPAFLLEFSRTLLTAAREMASA